MRWFAGQSLKGGRCAAINRNYKSKKAENNFETLSE